MRTCVKPVPLDTWRSAPTPRRDGFGRGHPRQPIHAGRTRRNERNEHDPHLHPLPTTVLCERILPDPLGVASPPSWATHHLPGMFPPDPALCDAAVLELLYVSSPGQRIDAVLTGEPRPALLPCLPHPVSIPHHHTNHLFHRVSSDHHQTQELSREICHLSALYALEADPRKVPVRTLLRDGETGLESPRSLWSVPLTNQPIQARARRTQTPVTLTLEWVVSVTSLYLYDNTHEFTQVPYSTLATLPFGSNCDIVTH